MSEGGIIVLRQAERERWRAASRKGRRFDDHLKLQKNHSSCSLDRCQNWQMTLARRMAEIQPFQVMEIWNRAKELEAQGKRIIQMQIGEPDFTAPDPVIAASIEALRQHPIHYTSALGMPLLRHAISHHYRERYRLEAPAVTAMREAGTSRR